MLDDMILFNCSNDDPPLYLPHLLLYTDYAFKRRVRRSCLLRKILFFRGSGVL